MIDFLGIGAQKAGTTWLYAQLSIHPQVRFPAGKELHRLNKPDFTWNEYLPMFPDDASVKQGEITPAYGFMPPEMIARTHSKLPHLQLIYMVRNPIDRAWSSALMALKRTEMQPEEASDQWFLDHFHSEGSLARGNYEECIRNWINIYKEKQLLILCFESVILNPRPQLLRVCKHLNIDASYYENISDEALGKKVHAGLGTAIRPALRDALTELYRYQLPYYESLVKKYG